MNDTKLVRACKAGDRSAMKFLYERFYGVMLGVCQRYAAHDADAQDLVQDGFLKVFGDLHSFSGKGSLEGWIRRVMINNALMQLRKKKVEFAVEDPESAGRTNYADIGDETEQNEISRIDFSKKELIDIIRTLPAGFGQVLNMYVIDGYKHREIAEILGISEGTSKSQLNRARKLMKQKIRERMQQQKAK